MDGYEFLRWVHIALSVTAFLWLGIRSGVRWRDYPYTIRLFILTMLFYVFATIYGTAEALYKDIPSGPRIFVYLMATVCLLVSLGLTQKKRLIAYGESDIGGGPHG